MSDHRIIRFSLKCDKTAPIRCRNIKRTNWQRYDEELCGSVGLRHPTTLNASWELSTLLYSMLIIKHVQNDGFLTGIRSRGGIMNSKCLEA